MTTTFARPSGSHALDLVNTVDWRDDPGRRVDLMPTATAMAAWARHQGFAAAEAGACRRALHRRRAVALRETLGVLFAAVCKDSALPPSALAELSRWTQDAWRQRRLTARSETPRWGWGSRTSGVDRLLFAVAIEAGELLLSPDSRRVRICAGAGCGWFFLDRSKAGRRRWCAMESCGNRVKVRSYRQRVVRG